MAGGQAILFRGWEEFQGRLLRFYFLSWSPAFLLQKSQTEMASSFEEANQSLERKVFLNIPRIQPKKFQMAMQRVVMQKSYRLSFVISNIQRTGRVVMI